MTDEKKLVIHIDPSLKKIVPKFLEVQRSNLDLMKAALPGPDYTELKRLGHKMRGSCGGYGFHALGGFGHSVELAAEAEDLAAVKEAIRQIEEHFSSMQLVYENE
ncbi:MAG: Hpt domain-containing protein [Bdellovibrionales bacterium]